MSISLFCPGPAPGSDTGHPRRNRGNIRPRRCRPPRLALTVVGRPEALRHADCASRWEEAPCRRYYTRASKLTGLAQIAAERGAELPPIMREVGLDPEVLRGPEVRDRLPRLLRVCCSRCAAGLGPPRSSGCAWCGTSGSTCWVRSRCSRGWSARVGGALRRDHREPGHPRQRRPRWCWRSREGATPRR